VADPHPSPAGPDRSPLKSDLRRRLLAARRTLSHDELGTAATAIATHALGWEALSALGEGDTVTAYVSVGSEPGTGPLLAALHGRRVQVLLPVLLPDGDLDWAAYAGPAAMTQTGRGLVEPTGARLGVDAVRTACVVVAPGLAASSRGDRLGRGGGSYDRALARLAPGTPVAVLLHAGEVGLEVPTEAHDRPVTHAVTPDGVVRLARTSG
jgi:5-formyltetrahydrofolate cyclo-ligase